MSNNEASTTVTWTREANGFYTNNINDYVIVKYVRTRADTCGFGGAGTFWGFDGGDEHTTLTAAKHDAEQNMRLLGLI
ncbi:MAG: hypothetical protein VW683_16700 [Betaproteobacteria bacterium]